MEPALLLERDELFHQLGAAGLGRLVFVGGEAGVGKTSLVRAFGERSGKRVLSGMCEALTTPSPLGPFVDLSTQIGGEFAAKVASRESPREVALALAAELDRPVIVVLEDLHWADEASLDVLRVLGRRIGGTKALVLATYRDELTRDHPLRIVLGELASTTAVTRCTVPPLSLEAVRVLAAPRGVEAESIFALTRGNPFFVTEVLAAGSTKLPSTVIDAVLARAASLDAAARRLLDVVAVIPATAEHWLLEQVAPVDIDALGACITSGMLREETDGVAFRHELARLAIESAIPPNRRRALHSIMLVALSTRPSGEPDDARLAHHAEEAGDAGAVLKHGRAAGDRAAALGAHREAAAQYARAQRHSDLLAPAAHAGLLAAYAQEAQLTGKYAESIDARREAIAIYRGLGDHLAVGDNLARLPNACVSLGLNAEAEEASRAAIAVLEALEPSRELAGAYAFQSYTRMLNRDNAEGVEWGKKALDLAERLDDADTAAMALIMTGTSFVMGGEIERGVEYLERSLDLSRRRGFDFRISSALGMLGSGLGEVYRLASAERYLREQIAFAEEHDLDSYYSRSWLACVLVYQGRWDDGTEVAGGVLARSNSAISQITARVALGRVRARRGDPGVADALDGALELALPGGHVQRLGHLRAARAEAAWLVGDHQRAIEEARAGYDLAVEKRHPWFAGELAYWQWKVGSLASAPDWIAEPWRLQVSGNATAAATSWREHGCPYEAARALAESDQDGALLDALNTFQALGARPAAAMVARRLRERGVRDVPRGPRASTLKNRAKLTSREVEILSLVAQGLRNSEIASRLFLSKKTVDHHVSAILRKLEVKTRGEAAAQMK